MRDVRAARLRPERVFDPKRASAGVIGRGSSRPPLSKPDNHARLLKRPVLEVRAREAPGSDPEPASSPA